MGYSRKRTLYLGSRDAAMEWGFAEKLDPKQLRRVTDTRDLRGISDATVERIVLFHGWYNVRGANDALQQCARRGIPVVIGRAGGGADPHPGFQVRAR